MTVDWNEEAKKMRDLPPTLCSAASEVAKVVEKICETMAAETDHEATRDVEPSSFRLRVRYVDMDGYLGRDRHPEKWMTGLVVRPLHMLTLDDEGVERPVEELAALAPETTQQVWLCAVPLGTGHVKVVEFMDHELERV